MLNVDHSPTMKQYVGLLELICSSSPIPTAEVLQDVSVLYARLGTNILIASFLFQTFSHTLCLAFFSLTLSHLSAAHYVFAH